MNCPECDAPNAATRATCQACKAPLRDGEKSRPLCDWQAGCTAPYTQRIAGQGLCTQHYLAWQDAHPETKPATVLAAERYRLEHPEFERRPDEDMSEYIARLQELRPVGGVGSAVAKKAGHVGMAQTRVPRRRRVCDDMADDEWWRYARARGLV